MLYKKLIDNIETLEKVKYNSRFFQVADNIKLKMKLIDL